MPSRSIAQLKDKLTELKQKKQKNIPTTKTSLVTYITNNSLNVIFVIAVVVVAILLFVEGKGLLKQAALILVVFLFIGSIINISLNGAAGIFHFSHFLHSSIGIVFIIIFGVLVYRQTGFVKSAEKILIQAAFIILVVVVGVTIFVSYNFYSSTEAFRKETETVISDIKDSFTDMKNIVKNIEDTFSGIGDFIKKIF